MPLTIATKCLDGLEWSREKPIYNMFCGYVNNVRLRAKVFIVAGINFVGDESIFRINIYTRAWDRVKQKKIRIKIMEVVLVYTKK